MRWPVFAVFAFLAVAVQLSLRSVLTLYSVRGVSPDLVACLAVFIALFAQRSSALWACWILGLLLDLAPPDQPRGYHLLGPHALGYVVGGYFVLLLRTMVFRRRALTVGFLTLIFAGVTSLVIVMLLAVRSWYPGEPTYGALSDLGLRWLAALYTGVVAIAVGWALGATLPLWGFQSGMPRRGGWQT